MAQVKEIAPGIRLIVPDQDEKSAWQSPNLYLIGDDPALLIDAGYDREDNYGPVLEALGGSKLELILLTHAHIDHAGGAWKLKERTGAKLACHPKEGPGLDRRFKGKKPDLHIEDGQTFKAGEIELTAILTPGHAPGHLMFHIASAKIVFSGDLVTGSGSTLVAPPEGDMKKYMESLHKLKDMNAEKLFPGHGRLVDNPEERVEELIEHRQLRELAIAKSLSTGPKKIKDLVMEQYQGYIHPHLEFAAAGTAWAHLIKMEKDGAVLSEPKGHTNPFEIVFSLAPDTSLPFPVS